MSYQADPAKIYQQIELYLGRRSNAVVFAKQYDNQLRVVAARLLNGGVPYTVPAGYNAYVREGKTDGTYVHNAAVADGSMVYITLTQQMLAVAGRQAVEVEIVKGEGADVLSSATFWLDVEADPVPEHAIESSDEYLTLQQLIAQAHAFADAADASAQASQKSADASQKSADASAVSAGAAGEAAQYIQDNMDVLLAAPPAAEAAAQSAAEAARYEQGAAAHEAAAKAAAEAAKAGTLIDEANGDIYKLGVSGGMMYFQFVSEGGGA